MDCKLAVGGSLRGNVARNNKCNKYLNRPFWKMRLVNAKNVLFADKLLELRKDKGPWAVIDEIVKYWESYPHKEWKAHLIEIRESRKNRFGSSKGKDLRYIVDVPEKILYMIRSMYKADELDMNKEWFRQFGKRYKQFLIPQKI